jgi:ribosomal protein S18 acetylase RimI-like enzyme
MKNREHSIRVASAADVPAVTRIHVASFRDAYKDIMPVAFLAGVSVDGSIAGWKSTFAKYPDNFTVAMSPDGAIDGFCCAGPVVDAVKNAPFEFQVYGLHVFPNCRRQGIGAALFQAAFARARRDGMSSAIVWTARDLALSRRFYEREGGTVVKTGVWSVGGLALPEVAYGWTSLDHYV